MDAFVLPYLGRSMGVVFWGVGGAPRRARAQPERPAEETLAIYAPAPLSPGEVAELRAALFASLGRSLRDSAQAPAGRVLTWWWVGGVAATALLAARSLEFGPGAAWLALVAGLTALPFAAGRPVWPPRAPGVARALHVARRARRLEVVAGTDRRQVERVAEIWRVARRLSGPAAQQLRELEAHCRETGWRAAAEFYAAQGQRLLIGAGLDGARGLRGWLQRRARPRPVPAGMAWVEMRSW
jgi:hypothetical protein